MIDSQTGSAGMTTGATLGRFTTWSSTRMSRLGDLPQGVVLLVGPAAYLAVFALALLRGLRFDYMREGLWQFIPAGELASDPAADVWLFHSQPPGFNLALAILDRTGSMAPYLWQGVMVLGTCLAVWMVSDIVHRWTGRLLPAAVAGLAAALVPGTLFYSMWLFYTQSVAILLVITVWGLVHGWSTRRPMGFAVSILGMLALFLTRSSFVWAVAVSWVVIVTFFGLRRRASGRNYPLTLVVASVFAIVTVGVFTVKDVALFGSWSQSSWSAENYAKTLLYTMGPKEAASIAAEDACLAELVSVGTFQGIEKYPACVRDAPGGGFPASDVLDEPTWSDGAINYNYRDRLTLSQQWTRFIVRAVEADPMVVGRVMAPSLSERRRGSFVQFLWPSADYPLLKSNLAAAGSVGKVWIWGTSWVPALLLAGWAVFLGLALIVKGMRTRHFATYVLASGLVACLCLAYLVLEVGENQRFRAELDPMLVALGVTGLWRILQLVGHKHEGRPPSGNRPSK